MIQHHLLTIRINIILVVKYPYTTIQCLYHGLSVNFIINDNTYYIIMLEIHS